jgi:hypothetical protein
MSRRFAQLAANALCTDHVMRKVIVAALLFSVGDNGYLMMTCLPLFQYH